MSDEPAFERCLAKNSFATVEFQRIYPTRVTTDVKLQFPERFVEIGSTPLEVAQAIQKLRDLECEHVRTTLDDCSRQLSRQLSHEGRVAFVFQDPNNQQMSLIKNWNLKGRYLHIRAESVVTAIDTNHSEGACDAFLADQQLQDLVRTYCNHLMDLYNGNLMQQVLGVLEKRKE